MKAPKGLKNGAVYEMDYNTKGIPNDVIPVLDTFIAEKHQKFIEITVINQSDDVKWIPQASTLAQYISLRAEHHPKKKHRESSTNLESIHRKLMSSTAEARMTSSPQ